MFKEFLEAVKAKKVSNFEYKKLYFGSGSVDTVFVGKIPNGSLETLTYAIDDLNKVLLNIFPKVVFIEGLLGTDEDVFFVRDNGKNYIGVSVRLLNKNYKGENFNFSFEVTKDFPECVEEFLEEEEEEGFDVDLDKLKEQYFDIVSLLYIYTKQNGKYEYKDEVQFTMNDSIEKILKDIDNVIGDDKDVKFSILNTEFENVKDIINYTQTMFKHIMKISNSQNHNLNKDKIILEKIKEQSKHPKAPIYMERFIKGNLQSALKHNFKVLNINGVPLFIRQHDAVTFYITPFTVFTLNTYTQKLNMISILSNTATIEEFTNKLRIASKVSPVEDNYYRSVYHLGDKKTYLQGKDLSKSIIR